MLDKKAAMAQVEKTIPNVKSKVCVRYNNIYIVRAEGSDPDEGNYDPFFSVDPSTGEVEDFSVLTDGDINEIARLFSAA